MHLMRALIQRVSQGSVTVNGSKIAEIGQGYVILLGIFKDDTEADVDKLVPKVVHLRIMGDEEDKMNKSILDTNGEIIVVSQFTLCADTRKGRRPSFIPAMNPKQAEKLYELFVQNLSDHGVNVQTGQFGSMMQVEIINDGPTTLLLESK